LTENSARSFILRCAAYQRKLTRIFNRGLTGTADLPMEETGKPDPAALLWAESRKAKAKVEWLRRQPNNYWPQLDRGQ
jgi:hypothetical protein